MISMSCMELCVFDVVLLIQSNAFVVLNVPMWHWNIPSYVWWNEVTSKCCLLNTHHCMLNYSDMLFANINRLIWISVRDTTATSFYSPYNRKCIILHSAHIFHILSEFLYPTHIRHQTHILYGRISRQNLFLNISACTTYLMIS